jgi:hypothetical protein
MQELQLTPQWRKQQARQQPELLWGCPEKPKSARHNAKIQIASFKGSPAKGCSFCDRSFLFTPFLTTNHKEQRKFLNNFML